MFDVTRSRVKEKESVMDATTQTVLWAIAAVLLVAFLARRRARLRREE